MTITTEQCEARIWRDAKLMKECLNDSDFADWLISSIGPMDNDALEFGERVKDYIERAVEAHAEWMAEEINRDTAEHEYDASRDEVLDDPRRGQAADLNRVNRMSRGY